MEQLLANLKQRKLVQWALAYLAAAWVLLQVLDMMGEHFDWPAGLLRGAVVTVGIGFFVALLLAWYHGDRGEQRISSTELLLITLVLTIGGGLLWRFVGTSAMPVTRSVTTADTTHAPQSVSAMPATAQMDVPTESNPVSGKTLAILPFKPLMPGERNEALEIGMAESLISHLGKNNAQVISPLSSVRRFATIDLDAVAAGRALDVDSVLEGSLQRSGDRLRVSVRLLRVVDGQQLWAQDFDQDFTTIFDVQDAIAARVAQSLSVHFGGPKATRGAPYTKDPEAYALYVSGRGAWSRQAEAGLLQAISFFEQAIARDPSYALAYSGLADSLALLGVFGIRAPNEVFPRARLAAEKALTIDPDLAAAHVALGHVLIQYEHDVAGGEREYARAMSLDPTLALIHHRRGLLLGMQGEADAALASYARAQELEPLWLGARAAIACYRYYLGQYDESIRILEQVLAVDDRLPSARTCLVRNLLAKGNYDRALIELDRGPIQAAPGSVGLRAQTFALLGRHQEARVELDRVLERSRQHYVPAYDIAATYAVLAEPDNTFLWLDRAMEDRSTLLPFLSQDPRFSALHSDPKFAELVQRIGVFRQAPLSLQALRPGTTQSTNPHEQQP